MRILFQGDSITDGNRIKDNEWDLNHQIGHSYAYIITAQLKAGYWNRDFVFLNRGISGNRVADLYARLQDDMINLKPDVLSLLVGVNDVYHQIHGGKGTTPARYEKIYRMMLDEVCEALPQCKVILCEPFILPVGQVKENYGQWSELTKGIQAAEHRVAADYPVIDLRLQQRFCELATRRDSSYWMWDGIHPTEAGHQIIADAWLEAAGGILGIHT